ncbi:MAG TPA: hypothetical protein VIX59_05210 [Candidatus Binataceae bacterium]
MKRRPVKEMPHNYAVQVLGKLPGMFSPKRYLYHCIRCRWSFVINDTRRGGITPVGLDGRPLSGQEAHKRMLTFHHGPCPELVVLMVEQPLQQELAELERTAERPTTEYSPRPTLRRA